MSVQDNPSDIKPTLSELKKTFLTHKTKPLSFRKQQLQQLQKGLKELSDKFDDALAKDIGASKFYSQAYSVLISDLEIADTINRFESWSKTEHVDTSFLIGPAKSYLVKEPYGVALVISAWNYPIYTSLPCVAQAMSAGNCVVLKPSEMAPHTSNVLKELFDKYLDKSCYRVIEGGPVVATQITSEPFDLIIFTGSPAKGKLVAKAAAENLIPCILELGGKSPTIVDQDVDIDNAALRIVQGKFMNSGQTCVACDYVFVHKKVAKQFVDALKSKLDIFFGDQKKKSVDNVMMINQFHTQRVKDMIDEKHGGTIVHGGNVDVQNRYVQPTIILKPSLESKLLTEEIFGPVLPILEFEEISKVIQYINERPKPLALYYFGSASNPNKDKVLKETSSGSYAVNEACFQILNPHSPFGGVGNSGLGAYHGKFGFDNCSHLKPVFEKKTINSYPFSVRYPPYTESKQKLLLFMYKNLAYDQGKVNRGLFITVMFIAGLFLHKKGYLQKPINTTKDILQLVWQNLSKQ